MEIIGKPFKITSLIEPYWKLKNHFKTLVNRYLKQLSTELKERNIIDKNVDFIFFSHKVKNLDIPLPLLTIERLLEEIKKDNSLFHCPKVSKNSIIFFEYDKESTTMCSKSKERSKDETISVKDSFSKYWQKSEINEPLEDTNINSSLNTNFDKFLVPLTYKNTCSEQNNNNDGLSVNEKHYGNIKKINKNKEIEENSTINNINVMDKANVCNNNDILDNISRKKKFKRRGITY